MLENLGLAAVFIFIIWIFTEPAQALTVLLVIVGLIILGVILSYLINAGEHNGTKTLNAGVISEVDEALKQIFLFRKDSRFWEEESDLLMLLPINQNGQLYAQDSEYIKLELLLYEHPDEYFFAYTKPKYLNDFDFVIEDGNDLIIKRTRVPYFELNYKQAMFQLFNHLNSKYPEYDWKYDKGRIMTNLKK